jgi:hypothetical protein
MLGEGGFLLLLKGIALVLDGWKSDVQRME